jgi:mRNA interferase YafQ
MLCPIYQRQFEKDVVIAQKRGKNINKLKAIINNLLEEVSLSLKNHNHKLKGEFNDYLECHIEPDWLLIYKKTKTEIILVRTGTHSDLF